MKMVIQKIQQIGTMISSQKVVTLYMFNLNMSNQLEDCIRIQLIK